MFDVINGAGDVNALDLLTKLDAYYTSAWTKLIVMVGAIGFVAPLLINYFQNRSFAKVEERFEKSLIEQRELFKRELADAKSGFADNMNVHADGINKLL